MKNLYHVLSGNDPILSSRLDNYSPDPISNKEFSRIYSIFFENIKRLGFMINFVEYRASIGNTMLNGYETNIIKPDSNYWIPHNTEITYLVKYLILGMIGG
jgi:hypothetical protein